jgi:diacylglycerol kinase family enzyme
MLRTIALALLLAVPALAAAVEPKFHAQLDAKIVVDGEATEMRAKLLGELGKPLSIHINDQADTKLECTFTAAPASPAQYVADIKITRNGKIISSPRLTSLYGQNCELQVSSGGKDEIRVSLNLQPRKS